MNRIYESSRYYDSGLLLKAKDLGATDENENKNLKPKTRPRMRTMLFVLEMPQRRGQVLEDTSLISDRKSGEHCKVSQRGLWQSPNHQNQI